jgi:ElaB/YqjD/DUF883 family membrane-anchored ribosome-binding protein
MRHSAALDAELRSIVDHAEALLEALADEGDANLARLRERVSASIDSARSRLDDLAGDAERARDHWTAAYEQWMLDNPWTVIAIGAGVGLLAGWLLARPRRTRSAPDGANPP